MPIETPMRAAGAWTALPQLSEAERACQGYQSTSYPDGEDQPGRPDPLRHGGRGAEDAAAHDAADDGHGTGEESQPTGVGGHR